MDLTKRPLQHQYYSEELVWFAFYVRYIYSKIGFMKNVLNHNIQSLFPTKRAFL